MEDSEQTTTIAYLCPAHIRIHPSRIPVPCPLPLPLHHRLCVYAICDSSIQQHARETSSSIINPLPPRQCTASTAAPIQAKAPTLGEEKSVSLAADLWDGSSMAKQTVWADLPGLRCCSKLGTPICTILKSPLAHCVATRLALVGIVRFGAGPWPPSSTRRPGR